MQRLADIDVAEPGDDSLIEQRGFEAGLFSAAGLSEHRGVERVAERFGAQSRHQRLGIELGARDELHRAETARVVEGDDTAGRHMKYDVIVREMPLPLVIIRSKLFAGGLLKNVKR